MPERRVVRQFAYRRSPDQDAAAPVRRRVVVVGAGPVGLTAALDLASRGHAVVLIDDADRIGEGSRGICYAKRTLEIWDRLGLGRRVVEAGVTWKVGKVYRGDRLIHQFDLLPEDGHQMPAFVNLQQFEVESLLVDRVLAEARIDLRWSNRLTRLEQGDDHVALTIGTPDGPYGLEAEWLVAADGARSPTRAMLGLGFEGETFEDKFLIADVKMAPDLPAERHFWFDPPFHAGRSALMHRQAGDVWRIDLQLGPDADAAEEQRQERVLPRLRTMLGDRPFELVWVSVYRFQCRRLAKFVQERVIFAGDAAHQVSPFGARGANSGVQDAENLAWKLDLVLRGTSPPRLLETYDAERIQAADENIGHSTRATDFIAPHSAAEAELRAAILSLAPRAEFARRMINSGRLSTATVYESTLSTPDTEPWGGTARLGAPLPDAAMRRADGAATFLLRELPDDFHILWIAGEGPAPVVGVVPVIRIGADLDDADGFFQARFDATPGATFVVRPDHHLCARFRHFDAARVAAAIDRAAGRTP